MFISTKDRGGVRHFVATDMDLEIARGTVRKLVSQGRDFGMIRQANGVTIWARHEPEKTNRWWGEEVERFYAHERGR